MVSELTHHTSGPGDRNHLILAVIQFGLLISVAISSELWFPVKNSFPSIPVLGVLQEIPVQLNMMLSFLFITSLIVAYTRKFKPRLFLILFSFLFAASCSLDYLRIQPWSYYYFFMILCLAVYYDRDNPERALTLLRFIMASIYIWSGIQKMNYSFLFVTYPDLIEPITDHLPEFLSSMVLKLGILGPVTELYGGLALFWSKTRRSAVLILTLVHLFILLMLGPFGKAVNIVIWPWNISFIILLWLLFTDRNKDFSFSIIFENLRKPFPATVIILFGILPAFSFSGWWPMYLSSALYSGNKVKSEIFLPNEMSDSFSELVKLSINESQNSLVLNNWTQAELNVAMYPDAKIHLEVFRTLCEDHPEFEFSLAMTTYLKPDILTGERKEVSYFCDELAPN